MRNQESAEEIAAVEFSVVIPVYNSAKTLRELVQRVDKVFKDISRSYELVFSEDGSKDGVWNLIETLHAEGYPIRAFRFMRNHGQHYALKCGLDNCIGRYAITMDDDLQHPPEEIPKLIYAVESNPDIDVVIGRYGSKKHEAYRNLGTLVHTVIRNAMFPQAKGISMTSLRIINRTTLEQIRSMRHANPRIGLMLLTATDRVMNVDVDHHPRQSGRSGYTLQKMLKNTFDNMINYSSIPLKFISGLGLCFSFMSLVLACFYFFMHIAGKITVSGFTTIVILVLLIGGILMFSFGLVGEYLSRIVSQQLLDREYYIRTRLESRRGVSSRRRTTKTEKAKTAGTRGESK
jgi:glycosyltransferase involved in cell wall biosynthesis